MHRRVFFRNAAQIGCDRRATRTIFAARIPPELPLTMPGLAAGRTGHRRRNVIRFVSGHGAMRSANFCVLEHGGTARLAARPLRRRADNNRQSNSRERRGS